MGIIADSRVSHVYVDPRLKKQDKCYQYCLEYKENGRKNVIWAFPKRGSVHDGYGKRYQLTERVVISPDIYYSGDDFPLTDKFTQDTLLIHFETDDRTYHTTTIKVRDITYTFDDNECSEKSNV